MKSATQQSHETVPKAKKAGNMRKLLSFIGLIIFAGTALTRLTNPIETSKTVEFLLFLGGSAVGFYLLITLYSLGDVWRKVFYIILLLLGASSIVLIFTIKDLLPPH